MIKNLENRHTVVVCISAFSINTDGSINKVIYQPRLSIILKNEEKLAALKGMSSSNKLMGIRHFIFEKAFQLFYDETASKEWRLNLLTRDSVEVPEEFVEWAYSFPDSKEFLDYIENELQTIYGSNIVTEMKTNECVLVPVNLNQFYTATISFHITQ
jgi:hypothetical protein